MRVSSGVQLFLINYQFDSKILGNEKAYNNVLIRIDCVQRSGLDLKDSDIRFSLRVGISEKFETQLALQIKKNRRLLSHQSD